MNTLPKKQKISNGVKKKSPFSKETYNKNAEMYKIMANPRRLEILNYLKTYGETAVEDLVESMGVRKSNASQNLAVLRHARLVEARREGVNAYYKITDPGIVETCRVLGNLRKRKMIP